jgi:hypothetical protein
MKFELFTPAWKSENAQRRAKALDGMKEEKLLAIVRDPSEDTRLNQVRQEAVQRLSPKSLAEVALDAKVDTYLRNMAICRVDDEQVLLAYLRDPTAWRAGDALERMHTGKLILESAMNREFFWTGVKRLSSLGDRENLRYLVLHVEDIQSFDAHWGVDPFEKDSAFLLRLATEAASEYIRAKAFGKLARKGLASAGMRNAARTRAIELLRANKPDMDLVWTLLWGAGPGESLSPEEQRYFYDQLRKDPLNYLCLDYLQRGKDPAGLAFMPFYEFTYRERLCLTEADYDRVLDVDEDFALDYLKAFISHGEGGNGKLSGPQFMISTCAEAIRHMHTAGKARARIERELPQIKHYTITYQYEDSENDIRDDRDTFAVRFWKES